MVYVGLSKLDKRTNSVFTWAEVISTMQPLVSKMKIEGDEQ